MFHLLFYIIFPTSRTWGSLRKARSLTVPVSPSATFGNRVESVRAASIWRLLSFKDDGQYYYGALICTMMTMLSYHEGAGTLQVSALFLPRSPGPGGLALECIYIPHILHIYVGMECSNAF